MIMFCAGTRPEVIKLAPVVTYCKKFFGDDSAALVDTGQHSESVMKPLLDFFGLSADVRLDFRRDAGSLASLNARLLESLGALMEQRIPQAVVVQGDTASAVQASMAAFLSGIPVGHVEAGLRSGNPWQPFPEEMNRSVIGRLSRWNFAPTLRAGEHLRRENVPGEIHVTGNTIVDAVVYSCARMDADSGDVVSEYTRRLVQRFDGLTTLLVTMHRREHWAHGISSVALSVKKRLLARPDLACIWVLHPNPKVAGTVRSVLGELPEALARRVMLVAPLSYPDMLYLMQQSTLLLTDSGGIQEEAVCMGLPLLIARDETERPEVVESGVGVLVGTAERRVSEALEKALSKPSAPTTTVLRNPLGDGNASRNIIGVMADSLEVAHA